MTRLSVAAAAEIAPERLALVGDGAAWTYAELAQRVAEQTLPEGPIALTPAADRRSVVRLLAALQTGRALALVHPRWTESEQEDARRRFFARARPGEVVVFTSGSSGRPKGVRLTHDALVAAARAHASALPFETHDRWLLTLPLAHVGGLSVLTRCLVSHACVALSPGRFDAARVRSALEQHRVTLLSVVPTMLERMLLCGRAPESLRAVLLGGAAASRSLVERARAMGWPVLPTYGASETCGQSCTQRLEAVRLDGVGPALPTVRVRTTVDGTIEVSGPTLMAGYLEAPSPLRDGWFRTRDRGEIDPDGHLHVHGRIDAAILSGGENVDPVEVEHALESHPDVHRATVVGLPDPEWGQRVVALVVGSLPLSDARAYLESRLARFKHPRAIAEVSALPELANGKRDRVRTRELAEERLRSVQ